MATAYGRLKQRIRPPGGRPMGRAPREPDTSTYGGRIAARLRELRNRRGWSIEEACDHLLAAGVRVTPPSLRHYEAGFGSGGRDMPCDFYPAVAQAYGYSTANGWLPTE